MTGAWERLAVVLRHLQIESADLVGRGMTSSLYDIGGGRVLKIHNGPQEQGYLPRLQRFSERLHRYSFPFAVPLIYEYGAVDDVHFHVERRLPGQDMAQVFPRLTSRERRSALTSLLDALPQLHAVQLPQYLYGEPLNVWEEITADTWPGYLQARIEATLAHSYADLQEDLPEVDRIVDAFYCQLGELPARPPKCLVHGDFFLGNVLSDERGILTAVVDFSPLTLIGDPLIDLAGAYYFCRIYDFVSEADFSFLRKEVDRRYGARSWQHIDLYYTFYSLRFSDCKVSDNHTYHWCLHRLRGL
ncbi:MAG: aminoglycoside phosphotransferase family protein [Caldilineaceae bacterium]|nr:aminoglycoside phosphotransferase family protein [Caldilineaceae bacterium]